MNDEYKWYDGMRWVSEEELWSIVAQVLLDH